MLIVEDVGGTLVLNNAKNPNSFVYRFVPLNRNDLTHGKLQALQVSINGNPVVFLPVDDQHPNGDTRSENQLLPHTVGASWPVQWVTVHDTEINGTDPFDANALAKAAFADDKDTVLLAEDRGDTLHDQLNTLDSVWAYKLNRQHPERNVVARFIALGLDRVAGVVGEED